MVLCLACAGQAAAQGHHSSEAWGCGSMQVTDGIRMTVSLHSLGDLLVTSPAVCVQKVAACFAWTLSPLSAVARAWLCCLQPYELSCRCCNRKAV